MAGRAGRGVRQSRHPGVGFLSRRPLLSPGPTFPVEGFCSPWELPMGHGAGLGGRGESGQSCRVFKPSSNPGEQETHRRLKGQRQNKSWLSLLVNRPGEDKRVSLLALACQTEPNATLCLLPSTQGPSPSLLHFCLQRVSRAGRERAPQTGAAHPERCDGRLQRPGPAQHPCRGGPGQRILKLPGDSNVQGGRAPLPESYAIRQGSREPRVATEHLQRGKSKLDALPMGNTRRASKN